MDNFIKTIEEYKKTLNEAGETSPPAPAGDSSGAPPAPPPSPDQGMSDQEAGGSVAASLTKKLDEIYKQSGKPYLDLASVLVSVIEDGFTDENRARLEKMLPPNVTLQDLRSANTNGVSDDLKRAGIQSAAITIFDSVKKIMEGENPVSQDNYRTYHDE